MIGPGDTFTGKVNNRKSRLTPRLLVGQMVLALIKIRKTGSVMEVVGGCDK